MIRALVGVVLATIVALIFGDELIEFICLPLWKRQAANGLAPSLQVLAPTALFTIYLKTGILGGLILSMPWVLFQIGTFVSSGLFPHERKFMKLLMPSSLGLFFVGVAFLYVLVLPVVLQFFISFNQGFSMSPGSDNVLDRILFSVNEESASDVNGSAEALRISTYLQDPENPQSGSMWINSSTRRFVVQTSSGPLSMALDRGATGRVMNSQFSIDYYISFVLMLALAFGITFETPIVVFFLAWTGIVSTASMAKARRYVLFGAVIAAAMLTPPDVISQVMLAGPMYLLFELGLFVARFGERRTADPAAG